MQAYQSAPCPYCGATWNQPGAQVCANCRNALPAPPPGYAPPGYAPQGQEPQPPAPGGPYGAPNYPPQGYPQMPQYPGAPSGYPGQPGQPGSPYPTYAPPGYAQGPGYPQQPEAYGQPPGYPSYAPTAAASGSTTLRLFGQTFTVPMALPPVVVRYQQELAYAILGVGGLIVLLLGGTPALAAMTAFTKMYAAIGKHDLAGAGAPYPEAQQKLQVAMSLDHAPGVPDALAKQISAFNDLVNNTESLVQAIANKDAAATKKYSDAVQAGLKTLTALEAALPANYEVKTYAHLQKGYDAAIKSLKG